MNPPEIRVGYIGCWPDAAAIFYGDIRLTPAEMSVPAWMRDELTAIAAHLWQTGYTPTKAVLEASRKGVKGADR